MALKNKKYEEEDEDLDEPEEDNEFSEDGDEETETKTTTRGRPKKYVKEEMEEVDDEEEAEPIEDAPTSNQVKKKADKSKDKFAVYNVTADTGILDVDDNKLYRDNEIAVLILNTLEEIKKKVTI